MGRRYFNLVDLRTDAPAMSFYIENATDFVFDASTETWVEQPDGGLSAMVFAGDPAIDEMPFSETLGATAPEALQAV